MKKTSALLITIIILLSACQKTPESPAVQNKNDGELESAIKQTAEPAQATDEPEQANGSAQSSPADGILSIPATEHWTENVVIENKNNSVVTFDIDADIYIMPDDIYPVARVGRKEFTKDDAIKFAGYFMNDKQLYENYQDSSRGYNAEKLKHDILILKQIMAIVGGIDGLSGEIKADVEKRALGQIEINEKTIAYWNENGKMPGMKGYISPDGEVVCEFYELEDDELQQTESVYTNAPGTPFSFEFRQREDGRGGFYDMYEMKAKTYNDDDTSDEFSVTNSAFSNYYRLSYSKGLTVGYGGESGKYEGSNPHGTVKGMEECLAAAGETIRDLGIEDFSLAQICVRNQDKFNNIFWKQNIPHAQAIIDALEGEQEPLQCYEFVFMKDINGVPCAAGKEIGKITGSTIAQDAQNDIEVLFPHEPETISICVDDSGVVSFEWRAPSAGREIENANVHTISLDEAKEKFLNQIRYENVWAPEDAAVTMKIDKVVKLMVKILMKDNFTEEYRYVPAYTFYGYKQREHENGQLRSEYGIVVTINAVDGSIIDRGNETFG